MIIRQAVLEDAEKLVHLIKQVENESEFLLWEPGERSINPEQQKHRIEEMNKEGNSAIFLADNKDELAGYLFAIGGSANRNKHSVYIVIGILKKYRGRGVGTQLFTNMDKWAKEQNIHRLELTVVTYNQAAVKLYRNMGFEIEGVKRHSLLINGAYEDEYYMAKIM